MPSGRSERQFITPSFTAIVFCFELTRDYQAILPLMLASVVAQLVAGALLTESLMTQKLARRGLHVGSDYEADVLASVTVDAVMTTGVETLAANVTIGEARDRFATGGHGAYPLVDGDGRCIGILARHDLLRSDDDAAELASTIASRDVVTIAPDATLLDALGRLLEEEIGHLPVVVGDKLLGMCTRTDILRARRSQLDAELRQPGWHHTPRRAHLPAFAAASNGHSPEGGTVMHAVLVVANQTLGGSELLRAIHARRVDGEIGEADPLAAIAHVLGRDADRYDEIIISTLPSHLSQWLRVDLPHRAQRAFRIPVTHVAGPPPPADEPEDAT